MFFFVYVRHFKSIVFAFNLDLYTLLVVHHSVNSCLLSLLCVSPCDVASVMI